MRASSVGGLSCSSGSSSHTASQLASTIESTDAMLSRMFEHLSASTAKLALGVAGGGSSSGGSSGPAPTSALRRSLSSPSTRTADTANGASSTAAGPIASAKGGSSWSGSSGAVAGSGAGRGSLTSGPGSLVLTPAIPQLGTRPGTPAPVAALTQPGPLTAAQRAATSASASAGGPAELARPRSSGGGSGSSIRAGPHLDSGSSIRAGPHLDSGSSVKAGPHLDPGPKVNHPVGAGGGGTDTSLHSLHSRSVGGSGGSSSSASRALTPAVAAAAAHLDDTSSLQDSTRAKGSREASPGGALDTPSVAAACLPAGVQGGCSSPGASPGRYNLTLDLSKIRSPFDKEVVSTLQPGSQAKVLQPACRASSSAVGSGGGISKATDVWGAAAGALAAPSWAGAVGAGHHHGPAPAAPVQHASTQVMCNLVCGVSELANLFGLDDVFIANLPARVSYN